MARPRLPSPAATIPNGFVASAVRLPVSSRNVAGRAEQWQGEAWAFWRSVGELRAVSTWIGNVLSRARLVPAKREGGMLVPITTPGPATEPMDALYGGPQGQSEMLQQLGVHLNIAGEAYIVNRATNENWYTLASGRVTQLAAGGSGRPPVLQADFGMEGGKTTLSSDDLVIRLWTPDPLDPTKADSPTRANLSTLRQIIGYDNHINAQITSRLAGNGVLFISSEVEFPVPAGADPNASPAHHFMMLLGESMLTPIGNPADPSALVPIVAMVPTESLGKNEHMKFWSDLDDAVVMMRDAAIKRLALGQDVPPEVLLGITDANHWNAWLSEESAVKAHLEPKLAVITYAITEQYYQPSLQGVVPDPENYFVIADTSSIRLRPNRSAEAIELYDRGELNGVALRRETGFQSEDEMGSPELRLWLLRKIATGSTSPEQTAAALTLLGADLGPVDTGGTNKPPPDDLRTDTEPVTGRREIPQRTPSQGLAAACDVLVFRALERAGNKLRNGHPRTDTTAIPPQEVYRHLHGDPEALVGGAWSCAPEVLAPYTDDVTGVIDTLDFYVRGLVGSQRPHSGTVLRALLESRAPEVTHG